MTERDKKDVIEKLIKPICGKWLDENTKYFVNANKLLAGLMVDIKQKDITKFNSKQAKGRKVGQ